MDVSNVRIADAMFDDSIFNGDISEWDVSSLERMTAMFRRSKFNGDISKWGVNNVVQMNAVFLDSEWDGDVSQWDVRNVKNMFALFRNSKFSGDVSKWNIDKVTNIGNMFNDIGVSDNLKYMTIVGHWDISIFLNKMQIGCKLHEIDDWFRFTPSEISKMAPGALSFWVNTKPNIIENLKDMGLMYNSLGVRYE